jgi:hypothetical protein
VLCPDEVLAGEADEQPDRPGQGRGERGDLPVDDLLARAGGRAEQYRAATSFSSAASRAACQVPSLCPTVNSGRPGKRAASQRSAARASASFSVSPARR